MNGGIGSIFLILFGIMLYGIYTKKQKELEKAKQEADALKQQPEQRVRRQSWVEEDEPTNAELLAEIKKLNSRIKELENKG